MADIDYLKKLSNVEKVMFFFFLLLVALGSLIVVAHLSWLGSIDSLYETVGPDDFTSNGTVFKESEGRFMYTTKFSHTGYTSIDSERITLSVSTVSDGKLRQFHPPVNKSTSQEFGMYSVELSGFLNQDKTNKVDTGEIVVSSPVRINNLSICLLYSGTPVSCVGWDHQSPEIHY